MWILILHLVNPQSIETLTLKGQRFHFPTQADCQWVGERLVQSDARVQSYECQKAIAPPQETGG